MMIDIKITNEILDAAACIAKATDAASGGIAVFIGAVRNQTAEKKVTRLEYECYESMAFKEIKKIADEAIRLWNVNNIIIHHRTGILHIGDMAVIIAVSSAHRDAAFDACRYIIDTLKKTVPIWKKEIFEGGEEWISAHA